MASRLQGEARGGQNQNRTLENDAAGAKQLTPELSESMISAMSAQEIMAELPKLTRPELEELDSKLHQLLEAAASPENVGQRLKRFAGAVRGLPRDMARNHDHYLHGRPRK